MKIKNLAGRAFLASILSGTMVFHSHGQAGDSSSLAEANNAFAIDFFKQASKPSENVIFSPYSISAAFALTYAGAVGDTASQMQKALHWTGPAYQVASEFAALNKILQGTQKEGVVQLSIANALWPQKGYNFQRDYLSLLEQTFNTSLLEADYAKQPETERSRINQWVEQQTKNRIKDLMPPNSINRLTRLVLANAIYFKADWQAPFRTNFTHPALFYLGSVGMVNVPFMAKQSNFRYAAMPTFKMLELPYKGKELSMLVILPDKKEGLPELEKELSSTKLETWTRALRGTEVSVFLPRFKMVFQLKLNDAMKALGMKNAFSATLADFSGMTGKRDLCISEAIHKAFVEFNEEGTEAAAATSIVMAPTSIARPREIPVFRADHPFLYVIRHDATGTILFLGG